jgi:GGDEF domain-containing protein
VVVHFILVHDTVSRTLSSLLNEAKIMLDIDNFKHVLDTYDAQTGDFVITRFAEIINQTIRTEDLFGRYNDEEFVIMPRGVVTRQDVFALCERIRQAIPNRFTTAIWEWIQYSQPLVMETDRAIISLVSRSSLPGFISVAFYCKTELPWRDCRTLSYHTIAGFGYDCCPKIASRKMGCSRILPFSAHQKPTGRLPNK